MRVPPIASALFFLAAASLQAAPAPTPKPSAIISRIKRAPIESSAIATVGYSKTIRALEIEFRNGAIYRYLEVPPNVYAALLRARSKARFYDDNVRHRYRSLHVRRRRLE